MLYSVKRYFVTHSLKNVDSGVGKMAHWVKPPSHTNCPPMSTRARTMRVFTSYKGITLTARKIKSADCETYEFDFTA